ncbi:hypothetical protein ACIPRI_06440 [Variovorax sp. LARHSF232]
MPPLSISWLRGGQGLPSSWLTPAQRAVRVLQVTRANWQVAAQAGRRRRGREAGRVAIETLSKR